MLSLFNEAESQSAEIYIQLKALTWRPLSGIARPYFRLPLPYSYIAVDKGTKLVSSAYIGTFAFLSE